MMDKSNKVWIFAYFMALCIVFLEAKKSSSIERIADQKDWKKLLRTRNNVLAIFSSSEKDFSSKQDLFEAVAKEMKGLATIVSVNCLDDKKLCKKLKASPNGILLKHYKDGDFHKDFDRRMIAKSMVTFLKDPTSDAPWEEEDGADAVVHLGDQKELNKYIKKSKSLLVMFYAPWCGHCKKMKPEYTAAASELKGQMVLAGMDVDKQDNMGVRMLYNITGFPTIIYFQNGAKQFNYGGGKTKADIIDWAKDPQPPKEPEKEEEWSDTESDVVHLGDEDFAEFMEEHPSVLVMFYAPWCGHCKKMKPEYVDAAAKLKAEGVEGVVAAVDATKATALGEKYEVKGYPTVKYFKNGEVQFDVNKRSAAELVSFMKDPQEPPPPPPPEPEWSDVESEVIHLTDETFKPQLKKKKNMLVMFYAPWCGHCKKAKPEYTQAAAQFAEDSKVGFAAVDCTKHKEPCNANDVQGYPTFIYFKYGKNPQKYTGGREEAGFVNFMSDPLNPLSSTPPEKAPLEDTWEGIEGGDKIKQLTAETFHNFITTKNQVLVMFYKPSCQTCIKERPEFGEAASALAIGQNNFGYIAMVNVAEEKELEKKYDIKGIPTLKFFKKGKFQFDFHGGRSAHDLVVFMKNPMAAPPAVPDIPWNEVESEVRHLTADNYMASLMDHDNVLVMYYAPWCGHCTNTKPYFQEAANLLKGRPDILFAAMDCTAYKEICQEQGVKGYPTIMRYSQGVEIEKYPGGRRTSDFIDYMTDQDGSQKKQEL